MTLSTARVAAMMRAEVHTMTSRAERHRRPELGEALREPTTPAALLDAVRDRIIGARQVFYHPDAPDVAWEPARRAATTANPHVNVAIFASPNVRGTLLEGRVSDFLDVDRRSRRLCLEDAAPPSSTTRLYAAVIVPYRAASPTPDAFDIDLSRVGERIRCAFTLNGKSYALVRTGTGLVRRVPSGS